MRATTHTSTLHRTTTTKAPPLKAGHHPWRNELPGAWQPGSWLWRLRWAAALSTGRCVVEQRAGRGTLTASRVRISRPACASAQHCTCLLLSISCALGTQCADHCKRCDFAGAGKCDRFMCDAYYGLASDGTCAPVRLPYTCAALPAHTPNTACLSLYISCARNAVRTLLQILPRNRGRQV